VEELVYQHSVFATTCDLAGIPVPQSVEFPSLANLARGHNAPVHDAIFSYYRDFQRTVRTKTHKLIVYPQIQKTQLFDLIKDPWEINDLANDNQFAALKHELVERLKRFQVELGDNLNLEHPRPSA
jgi:choline-sulfatase